MKKFNTLIALGMTKIDKVEWSFRNVLKSIAWLVLGALLLFFVGFDVALALFIDIDGDDDAAAVFGIVFSQITLLATWSALAPVGVVARIGSGLGTASLISLALLLSILREQDLYIAWSVAAVTMVMWFAIQIPLWIMRLTGGWRLGLSERATTSRQSTQFGIRQLLVWITAVGAWLGIARFVIPTESGNDRGNDLALAVVIFFVFLVFNSLSALPITWAAFAPRLVLLWLVVAVIFYAVISYAETVAFENASGKSGGSEIFWAINAIQFVGAFVPLLLLRFCGVRLVRGGGLNNL